MNPERQSTSSSSPASPSSATARTGLRTALLEVFEGSASLALPGEIRRSLFASLFTRVGSIGVVMLSVAIIGVTEYVRTGNLTAELATALDVVLLLLRCLLILRYQRRHAITGNPSAWIFLFGVLAIGSSACWGVVCLSSFAWGHDPVLYTLPATAAAATAGAIAARNSAFPRIALSQIVVSLVPLAIGSACTDDRGNAIMLLLVPLMLLGLRAVVIDRHAQLISFMLAQTELKRLAHTDPLTGLGNRRHFDAALEEEWRRAARAGAPVSLLLLDADRFKRFNDLYGHQQGDLVLIAVADTLRSFAQRAGDLAARQGGEEFALLLPGTDLPDAAGIAEQLRRRVEALGIQHGGSGTGIVTVSIGVACAWPGSGHSGADLFAIADQALYRAKAGGRNRVERLRHSAVDSLASRSVPPASV